MSDWLRALWNGMLFRDAAFAGIRDRRDAFLQGFLIVVIVGLLVGLPTLVGDLANGLRPNAIEVEMDKAMSEMDQMLQQMQPFLGNVPGGMMDTIVAQIKENMTFGFEIARQVEALPTILPKPVNTLFENVGTWASKPFTEGGFPLAAAALGTWLGYGIWVMLFAKLLGGRGTLAGFFGATALYATPHLLSIFAFVPLLGSVLSFIGYIWGLALYVKGTAISHELSLERALLAVLLPLLIILLLVIISATGLATLVAISVAGGGR
jgi:hypothetical protein